MKHEPIAGESGKMARTFRYDTQTYNFGTFSGCEGALRQAHSDKQQKQ